MSGETELEARYQIYARMAAHYDTCGPLPGADDPRYVHTNATWSPDGEFLVFSRAKAKDAYQPGGTKAEYANDPKETQIQYDLYRIPFNGGKGGRPEPVLGASGNGMSNTFPKISPDGRWVAYEQRYGVDARIATLPLPAGLPRSFTEGPGLFIHPAWSPDGSEIAYLEEHEVASDLWIGPVADGLSAGPARRVETGGFSLMWPRWSPDGAAIAYIAATGDSWDIWIVAADGNSKPRQVTEGGQVHQITWMSGTPELLASGKWGRQAISLHRVDPQTGEHDALDWSVDFGLHAVFGMFDVGDDASLALYTFEEVGGDLWMLEGSNGTF